MTYEERLWVMDLFSLEKRDLRGNLQLNVVSAATWSEDIKETEADYSWRCAAIGWEAVATRGNIYIQYEVFSLWGCFSIERDPETVWGKHSILGHVQDSAGHESEEPDLITLPWAGWMSGISPKSCLPDSANPWFCVTWSKAPTIKSMMEGGSKYWL